MLQGEEYDSDTSDEDFVPDGVESEDEPVSVGEEEENEAENSMSTKKRKKSKKGKNTSAIALLEKEREEEEKIVDEEQNKKKANNLWADFLADVEDEPSLPKPKAKASWGALLGNKKTSGSSESESSKPLVSSSKSEVKKKETATKPSTVKITQVFEFAGEEVRVEKEVDANSEEAKQAKAENVLTAKEESTTIKGGSATPGVGGVKRSGAGLSSLVGLLENKKQKLTTLEKTKLDWNRYKTSEGIDEELEKHKKSKDGYLDKQAFLERADHRQFEIERAVRMGKKSKR